MRIWSTPPAHYRVLCTHKNIISNVTIELNLSDSRRRSWAFSASHRLEYIKRTNKLHSENRSSSIQLRHQRHQRRYWLSGISKWALAARGEEALGTKPCTHSNSIKPAWAQHFSSAAALCCLENWKILVMLLASSCYLPEADAVMCESLGTGRVWSAFLNSAAMLMSFLPRVLMFNLKADGFKVKVFGMMCVFVLQYIVVLIQGGLGYGHLSLFQNNYYLYYCYTLMYINTLITLINVLVLNVTHAGGNSALVVDYFPRRINTQHYGSLECF